MANELLYKIGCGYSLTVPIAIPLIATERITAPIYGTGVLFTRTLSGNEIEYNLEPQICTDPCYEGDPLSDAPEFSLLQNIGTGTSAAQYGLKASYDIGSEINPYVSLTLNWKICDNRDYCDGPDVEGQTQDGRYIQRWAVVPMGTGYSYGRVGGTMLGVPSDLFQGVNFASIDRISICFDATAKPVFAYQTGSGSFTITRFVAGTPTTYTFDGDWPRLFYNGVLQRDLAQTDVICFYVKDGQLKTRFQRDNFATEYTTFSKADEPVLRLNKVDRNQSFHRIYFYDVNNVRRLVVSEDYPPFPAYERDNATASASPEGGLYLSATFDGGTYSDVSSNTATPDGGSYNVIVYTLPTVTENSSNTTTPDGGTYSLIVVAGGTYTDSSSNTATPEGGDYNLISVSGGTYTDASSNTASPEGGTYS